MRFESVPNSTRDMNQYALMPQANAPRVDPSVWAMDHQPTEPIPGDLLVSEDGAELYVYRAGGAGQAGTWQPVSISVPEIRRQAVEVTGAGDDPTTYPWVNPPLEGDMVVNTTDDRAWVLLNTGTWFRLK